MSGRNEPVALMRLRHLVGARLGLHLNEVDEGVLAGVLERCAAAGGGGVGVFLDRLASPGAARELEALAGELTVGETYFFRDADQLRAFGALAAGGSRCERILSAGCASGEEAYSLAILTRDRPATTIVGVDVNAASIARARRARYSEWSLRQTPLELRASGLREAGSEWVVDEAIRARVSFEVRNLVEDAPELWRPESFDVIFLRNVIMYFSREVAGALLARLARALRPGGHLFLGHARVAARAERLVRAARTRTAPFITVAGRASSRLSCPSWRPRRSGMRCAAVAAADTDGARRADPAAAPAATPPRRPAHARPPARVCARSASPRRSTPSPRCRRSSARSPGRARARGAAAALRPSRRRRDGVRGARRRRRQGRGRALSPRNPRAGGRARRGGRRGPHRRAHRSGLRHAALHMGLVGAPRRR